MRNLIIAVILSAFVASGVGYLWGQRVAPVEPSTAATDTVYDRVIKSGKIRCGYVVVPPSMSRNANTGTVSGFSAEIVTKLASDLGLKVEWVEETPLATAAEGLRNNRYDMLCTSILTTTLRGKAQLFTMPVYYTVINAYARKDDVRFKDNEHDFDNPKIRISAVDGDIASIIAHEDAPRAQLYSLPDVADLSERLVAVKDNKADVTYAEAMQLAQFEKVNPGVIRNITPDKPVRVFVSAYAIKMGEWQFVAMIDNALRNLVNNGFVDKTITKYTFPGAQKMIARPYQ